MLPRTIHNHFYISLFITFVFAVIISIFISVNGKYDSFQLINSNHHGYLDIFFRFYTHAGDAIVWLLPLIYCLFKRRDYLVAVIAGFLISTALTHFFKRVVYPDELRPFTRLSENFPIHMLEGIRMNRIHSFPSGHTVTAFTIALLTANLVNKKTWAFVLPVLALLAGYSRVYLGQHYLNDILAGICVGIAAALLSLLIYLKFEKRSSRHNE